MRADDVPLDEICATPQRAPVTGAFGDCLSSAEMTELAGKSSVPISMTWWEILTFAMAVLFMLGGLIGTVLPVLPGIPVIFVVSLLYAFIDGFQHISEQTIGIFAVLTGAALLMDYLATVVGIKKMGGSYFGVAGAVIGMIVGFFVGGGLPGLVIGSFVGAVACEMLIGKKSQQALKAGLGAFLGFFLGGVVKFAIAATMIGVFIWKVLTG